MVKAEIQDSHLRASKERLDNARNSSFLSLPVSNLTSAKIRETSKNRSKGFA